MNIRSEQAADHRSIHELTQRAFAGKSYSDGSEPFITDTLRDTGKLTLSLVAIKDNEVVGHAAFSSVTLAECTGAWYGLGPISVEPDLQRTGIGSALVKEGLSRLEAMDASGCVLIGDPAYYARFGFAGDGRIQYQTLPSAYVQWIAFGQQRPEGVVEFDPAFGG